MWPIIGLGIRTWGIFYGLAVLVHLGLALWYCRRMRIRYRVGVALNVCYAFGMGIGARILYDLLHSRFDWRNYLDVSYLLGEGFWGGPLAYLALAVAFVVLLGSDRLRKLDLTALALPIPMLLCKVGCFFNGCCYGAPSDLPWAIAFPEGAKAPAGIARHPTQLYEILVLAIIVVAFHLLDRPRWKGTLVLWFVFIYGLGRPATEYFRAADQLAERIAIGPFTDSQAVCLGAAVAAGITLLIVRPRIAEPLATTNPGARGIE